MRHILVAALATAACLAAAPAVADDDATAPDANSDGKLVLLLDSSGSMQESAGGQSKISAAKDALTDVVSRLPEDAEVGVRVFGATVFSADEPGACTDTQSVVPVGPLDATAITQAVAAYEPFGETPIGNALIGAAEDLGSSGKRTIVLLSDGEPTCDPDPCAVAEDLRGEGVDLTVNVVGLNVSGRARSALECIAEAGGGTYYDVDEPDELASSLVTTSVRAFREFSLRGTEITRETDDDEPVAVEPGRFIDTTLGAKAPRRYTIDVPDRGGVVVSVVARATEREPVAETLIIRLSTIDGEQCAQGIGQRVNNLRLRSISSAAAYYSPLEPDPRPGCENPSSLIATVASDASTPFPYGLTITPIPEVTNADQLPAPSSEAERELSPVEPSEPSSPVVGGASFDDSPALEPGTYTDSIRPGEQLLYKVPVGWGQSPRVTVRVGTNAQADRDLGVIGLTCMLSTYSPFGAKLTAETDANVFYTANYNGTRIASMTNDHGPVVLRNIESGRDLPTALSFSGDYYVSLEMASAPDARFAAPITISVDVAGQESGVPEFAEPTADANAEVDPSAEDHSHDNDDSPNWLLWGAGIAAIAFLAAAVRAVRRRRRSAE